MNKQPKSPLKPDTKKGVIKVNPELYIRIKSFCANHGLKIHWWTEKRLEDAINNEEKGLK